MQPLSGVIPVALGQDQEPMWGNASPPLLGPHSQALCHMGLHTFPFYALQSLETHKSERGETAAYSRQGRVPTMAPWPGGGCLP